MSFYDRISASGGVSIRGVVWPFVLGLLIVGWSGVAFQVRREREEAERAALIRTQNRAAVLEQHVVKTLQTAALAGAHLGKRYTEFQSRAVSLGIAEALRDDPALRLAGLSSAVFLNADRIPVAAIGDASAHPTPAVLAEISESLPAEQEVEVIVAAVANPTPAGIVLARPIVDNGSRAGFVVMTIATRKFLSFPAAAKFDPTDLVSVISLDGVTLARREGDRFSAGEVVRSGLVMQQQQRNPNGSYRGPSSLDGHVRYFSHRRLQNYPVFVTAGVSYEHALASATRRAAYYSVVMGLLSLAAISFALLVRREMMSRHRHAVELAQSMRRLEDAQRIGRIGDWEYDRTTRTLIWSDQLCVMYERAVDQDHLLLDDFAAYLEPGDMVRFERFLRDLCDNGGAATLELEVKLPSGASGCRYLTAVANEDAAGSTGNVYGTDQDITETRTLRELEKQVAHLDRQGAVNMMAGTLAHELNQPLAAASNFVSGALRHIENLNIDQGVAVQAGLRDGLHQIHNAAEIIRRVRTMVEIEGTSLRVASIEESVRASVMLLKASGSSNASAITWDIADDVPAVAISAIQLQQVLLNLLKNALEAVLPDQSKITVRAQSLGSFARIEVVDNGPGFPTGAGDVFSAFFTSKTTGTGLGLSISRTIIEFHGGKLFVDRSCVGETVLAIVLPVAERNDA